MILPLRVMSGGNALKFLWRGKASRKPGRMQATGLGPGSLRVPLLYRPAPEPGRWANPVTSEVVPLTR